MGELYRLDFPNGKSYIGITRQTAKHRFQKHQRVARQRIGTIIYNAWRKYGAPVLVRLAVVENDMLFDAEIRAIATFDTLHPRGYNMAPGGVTAPSSSPLVAAKIATKLTGRKLSAEHIARVALAHTGQKRSIQAKENMSRAQKGRTFSDATKAKMALAKLGRVLSLATRRKMSASQCKRRIAEAERSASA